jgi:hypothetical protein
VNPKIAGKWMFIPLELIIIGFDLPPYLNVRIEGVCPMVFPNQPLMKNG